MSWCPKCKTEYEEGTEKCAECGSTLVEAREPDNNLDNPVLLTTASDEVEADRIEALLGSSSIPVLRKYRESGGYLNIYMGNASYGIDLFVPSDLSEKAREIVSTEGITVEKLSQDEDNAFRSEVEKVTRKRSVRAWIVLLFLVPGLLLIALFLWRTLFR